MFKEDFLHYIWKYKLYNSLNLTTTKKEQLVIIYAGLKNSDGGPDFFNAKVKIGKTTWAGNVEIHLKSSDWIKHKHQHDKAYDNVILHVVYVDDKEIVNHNGETIPTIELKNIIDKNLIKNYEQLQLSKDWIACANQIKDVNNFIISNWRENLALERLERKSEEIKTTLKLNKNNWDETFYQYFFKYFGLKLNAAPFLLLAKDTPLKIFQKHNNLKSIEALLFGQAGFFNEQLNDEYFSSLKKEYQFLKSKFKLQPIDKSLWKWLRLRPNNFPTIRIAQLAKIFYANPRLFSQVLAINSVKDVKKVISVSASKYWDNHYQFGKIAKSSTTKKLGELMANNLIINVLVPLIFVYAKINANETLAEKSINWLTAIKTENNSIVKKFKTLGIETKNAMESQALIELKNNYCSQKKCLTCGIGNYLIKND